MCTPIDFAQLDKVNKHLSKVSEDFLNLFPNDVKQKLESNFYIAGGCIYSIYNNTEPNDYDIFIYNDDVIKYLLAFFMKYITKFKHGSIALGEYNGLSLVKTKYAISIGDKYQIIHKYVGSPQKVVEEFDFRHNMFYYKPEIDVLDCHNKISFKYLTTKEMFFNDFRCRDLCGVILRIPKFTNRGMTIQKKEIAKILTRLRDCINDENEKEILLDYTSTQGY